MFALFQVNLGRICLLLNGLVLAGVITSAWGSKEEYLGRFGVNLGSQVLLGFLACTRELLCVEVPVSLWAGVWGAFASLIRQEIQGLVFPPSKIMLACSFSYTAASMWSTAMVYGGAAMNQWLPASAAVFFPTCIRFLPLKSAIL